MFWNNDQGAFKKIQNYNSNRWKIYDLDVKFILITKSTIYLVKTALKVDC